MLQSDLHFDRAHKIQVWAALTYVGAFFLVFPAGYLFGMDGLIVMAGVLIAALLVFYTAITLQDHR